MAPPALPNVYTTPNVVFDYLGTEGVDLRLDDHNEATGQQVLAAATAAVGATALSVGAIQYPLIRGTTLRFDGGGMADVVTVVLSATATTGSTTLAVEALEGAVNAQAAAQDGGVNVALARRLLRGCYYGTDRVKLYACSRYDDAALAASWSAQRWATALAAQWLCRRRGNPSPESVDADAEGALEELAMLRSCALSLPDVGTRTAGWPFLSNVTVDLRYHTAKVRVEPSISEGTPTQYAQKIDWDSALYLEW